MVSILVADSGKGMGKEYLEAIDLMGHNLIRCETEKELLEILEIVSINLIIIDLEILVNSPSNLCRKIRSDSKFIDIPIIIASDKDSNEDVLDAIHAGANDYLLKPIKETPLIAKINNNLQTLLVHTQDLLYVKNKILFASRYKINRVLAYGSHAISFVAYDQENNNKQVVVKIINNNLLTEEVIEVFNDTASRIQNASLKNYVDIIDFGKVSGKHYMVLDYVLGGSLAIQIRNRLLSEQQLIVVAMDTLSGMISLHNAGILHLDIKPENILLHKGHYCLSDFGIIVKRLTNTLPLHAEIWSTTAYMAPENFEQDSVDGKSDVYSLGVTLFQGLIGDNPFAANNPSVSMSRQINLIPPLVSDFNHQISFEASEIIKSMLEKDYKTRPSPEELLQTFAELVDNRKNGLLHYSKIKNEHLDSIVASDLISRLSGQDYEEIKEEKKKALKEKMVFWKKSLSDMSFESFIHKIMYVFVFVIVICLSVGTGIWCYKMFFDYDYEKLLPVPPAAVVICEKCGLVNKTSVRDINDRRCVRCEGRVKYAVDCNYCTDIFPLVYWEPDGLEQQKDPMEKMANYYWCPNCASYDTYLLPLNYKQQLFEPKDIDEIQE